MPKRKLDHSDILILNILQNEGDISNKDLAKRLGVAPATSLKRVSRLRSLNLLPNCNFQLNKGLAGYPNVFMVKISLANQANKVLDLETFLLKDGAIEQLWNTEQGKSMGSAHYRALVRAKSDETFGEWCEKLMNQYGCIIEHERVANLLKSRSSLKLSYKDLMHLRSLEE